MSDEQKARVVRATLEIEAEGRTELVSLIRRDGEWVALSSDGRQEGPHVICALAALGLTGSDRTTLGQLPAKHTKQESGPFREIASALRETATAIVRAGVANARQAPSVMDALSLVQKVSGDSPPLGLARAMGRLRQALSSGNLAETARVLDGALRLVQDIDDYDGTPSARVVGWLSGSDGAVAGTRGEVRSISDRVLLEVGRTWVAGFSRRSLQRRYLLCLRSGKVYLEESEKGARATAGPSPRLLKVGLAESFVGPAPERIRLMQYEVRPVIHDKTLKKVGDFARRDFADLEADYRETLKAFPALSEPFVIVAADRYGVEGAFDSAGRSLRLVGDEGELDRLAQVRARSGVRWIGGILSDVDGTMVLSVHSVCVETDGALVLERIH